MIFLIFSLAYFITNFVSDTVYVQRFKRTELEEQNVSVKLTLSFLLDSMAEAKVAEADIALSVATLEERTLIMKGEIESLREQSRAILNKMELKNLRKCDDFKLKANLNQQSDYADDLEKANLQLCSDNRRQLLADLEKLYTSSVESNAQLLIQRDRNAQEIKAIQLLSQHCSNESNNILNKINLLKEERKNAEAALTNCLRLLETSRSAMEQAVCFLLFL